MAFYRMTPARRAALRKAQQASARRRRKGVKVARKGARTAKAVGKSQLKYTKRKQVAKAKRTIRHGKNELKLYKNVAVHGAQKLTGGKAKKRPTKRPVRHFVSTAKKNQAKYKKSVQFAKRVRRNEVRRATGRKKKARR